MPQFNKINNNNIIDVIVQSFLDALCQGQSRDDDHDEDGPPYLLKRLFWWYPRQFSKQTDKCAWNISILHWSQWSSIFLLSISIIEILKLMQINAICKIFGILHFYLCICSFSTYFKDVYIKTLTVYRSAPSQLSILIDYIRYISINKPNINMYLQDLQIARPSTHCER